MDLPWRLKFGIFMAPYHPVRESIGLAIRRDVRTLQWLDELGYDEAFIGEHHSGGWEPIASPELFIAHVARETESIRLGTGVVSLPYHHPYMLAERILLLDHLTRGRVMLGVGPGATPPDTAQLGLKATQLRPMLDEGLGVVLRLLRGEEVTHESPGWFKLVNASCQLQPWREEGIPVFIATTSSPAGATIAGKYGVGVLSGASFRPLGPGLKSTWGTAEEAAVARGETMDRRQWRVMTRIHVAESREQACRDVNDLLYEFDRHYFGGTLGRPFAYEGAPEDYAAWCVEHAGALFGAPDEVAAGIGRLWEQSGGGFGGILFMGNEFAPPDRTRESHELLARYVMPRFRGELERPARSHARTVAARVALNRGEADAIAEAVRAVGGEPPETILGARVTPPSG